MPHKLLLFFKAIGSGSLSKNFAWIFFLLFTSDFSEARFRISGGFGLGSTSTTHEVTKSEAPFTQTYSLEILISSKLIFGGEHLRSLKMTPMSTGISFTGLMMRYYLNSVPGSYTAVENMNETDIVFRDIGYFIGSGFGLAQSSLPTTDDGLSSNAAGLYLSPKAGVEIQLTKSLGCRAELLTAMTIVAKGSISSFSLAGSLYYSF